MRIATWNVNGIGARQEQLREWIEQDCPEVICLQEIKAAPEQVPASLRELDGYWSYWHGSKGYSGVALLIRKEVSNEPRCPRLPQSLCRWRFECGLLRFRQCRKEVQTGHGFDIVD